MAKLRPPRRLNLQEPEEILTLAQRLLEPVKRYWKWVLAGAAAVALALITWGVTGALQARKESQASQALAQVHLKTQDKAQDKAQETQTLQGLGQVIQEYPGTAAAREAELLRADLLYQQKNYAEAAKAYESLKERDPGLHPFVLDSLSYCYEGLGDFKRAAEVLKPAVEEATGPFQGEVWRRMAYLYEKAGEPREANQYWQKLLERPNQSPGVVPYLKEKVAATGGK